MPRTALHNRRSRRTSCSILALATVMAVGATPAAAQSFNGSGLFDSGTGSISTGAGTTTINVTSPQAVINWTPTDTAPTGGNIVFQNAGTTATFWSSGDFAVLNNIGTNVNRAIALNGTINSRTGSATGNQGGSVYFYAPGGFVIGGSSVFNVGNLVLSASPIQVTGGNFITGADRTVVFSQAPNPNATIELNGRINAFIPAAGFGSPGPGYVGIVAPKIVQNSGVNSVISANGSTALVAAEAATLSFSPDGLFSIQVDVGSDTGNGIEVYGKIGGETPTGSDDQQRVFLVGVPKNDAMTMLIGNGAQLGFDLAGSAVAVDGAVILSAGHDVTNGFIETSPSDAAGAEANISATGGHFTSSVESRSTGYTHLQTSGTLDFDGDLTVNSLGEVVLGTDSGSGLVDIDGDLFISTDRTGDFTGESVTASRIFITSFGGGTVNVGTASAGNTITLNANATGGGSETSGVDGGDATGGVIEVTANSGGSITFNGDVSISAVGQGGGAFNLGVNGGNGTGGFSKNYTIDPGSDLTYNGNVTIDVSGYGADGAGVECFCNGLAGNGQGGGVWYSAQAGAGGTFTVNGSTDIIGNGVGGFAGDENGGNGTGGNLQVFYGDGATTTLNGNLTMEADGTGGGSESGNGGVGQGGYNYIYRTNAPLTSGSLVINGTVSGSVDGQGGFAENNGTGGLGRGGLFAIGTNVGSITLNGYVSATSDGSGGWSGNGTGGAGAGGSGASGGAAVYNFGGGTIALNQGGSFSANGTGGSGAIGGAGTGGDTLFAADTGTASSGGTLSLTSDGLGGDGFGGTAGKGTGGMIEIAAINGGDVLITSNVYTRADGDGGVGHNSTGGEGRGGTVHVYADGVGSLLDVDGFLDLSADGEGGTGIDSNGGFGKGGEIKISAGNGAIVDFGGYVDASADGEGGDSSYFYGGSTTSAGDGEGGYVELFTWGTGASDLNLASFVNLGANGRGGDNELPGDASFAGDGLGGIASLNAQSGTIDITGGASLNANGGGGDATYYYGGGVGGTGTGKNAEIAAVGGDITLGYASVSANGYGGRGTTGGDGIGGGVFDNPSGTGTDGAHLFAADGTLTINGSAYVDADGYGGDAGYFYGGSTGGSGGDGTGGWARIFAVNRDAGPSSIKIQGVESGAYISADGYGGDGDIGLTGSGGLDGLAGTDGTIGTNGLDGQAGGTGGTGGSGGLGQGGIVQVTAGAGNGSLTIDYVSARAVGDGGSGGRGGTGGMGGTGGDGGDGSAGAGGNGGDGGDGGTGGTGGLGGAGIGGTVTFGTVSAVNQAATNNLGVSNFGDVYADASAYGGRGGSSGFGGSAGSGGLAGTGTPGGSDGLSGTFGSDGNGGAGGDATGGGVVLLVRGSTVNVSGTAEMHADAFGGDGGYGGDLGLQGDGGDALVGGDGGGMGVAVTPRYQHPDQHGTLNASAIIGTAIAEGGFGLTNGTSETGGANGVQFLDATGTIGSIDLTVAAADGMAPGATADMISLVGSTLTITDSFSFNTDGDLSVFVDNGTLNVNSLSLSAGNFVPDAANGAPTNLGSIVANDVSISTGDDFTARANWDVTNTFTVDAPGSILLDNVHDDDGIDFSAVGSITTADLDAGGDILLDAGGNILIGDAVGGFFEANAGGTFTSGDIDSDSDIRISAGDDVSLGALSAGVSAVGSSKAIRIDTDGSVLVGNILADGGIDVTAQGSVTGANVTTGDVLITEANGGIVYQAISAGLVNPQTPSEPFSVALDSATSINVGNVDAAGSIGFISSGTLTTGNLTTDGDVLGLVHGNINTLNIDADGRVLLADSSMFTNAGGTIGDAGDDDIDPETIFAATPVKTGGSITVGNVNAGSFTAAAGTSLTVGTLDTDSDLSLDAGGAITTGDLTVGNFVLANGGSITTGDIDADSIDMTSTAGNISTGDIFAFGDVAMDAFGDILTGDITAGSIDLLAGDDITTGDLTTQNLVLFMEAPGPSFLYPGASITLESGGDITTGAIDSIDGVHISALGAVSTQSIDAVDFVDVDGLTSVTTGAITAGDHIYSESNGNIATGVLNAGADINFENGGDISFISANAGTEVDFETDGSITGGNVTAANHIGMESGDMVNLDNLTVTGALAPDEDFSIGIAAAGIITVGDVSATNAVGFATLSSLGTGDISAGGLFMALVGSQTGTGSITTTGESGGQVYIADDSMFLTGGGTIDGDGDFDPSIVLALDPVATGGLINITGPVNTGLFQAAAGTNLTSQAITAGRIQARAGGMATLNGVWNSPDVELISHDITIGASGGISGGTTGNVLLRTTNSGGFLVGDGLTGSGFALSNAEFSRISSGDITIVAGGFAGVDASSRIGDLTITGPLASGNIRSNSGSVNFVTLAESGENVDGDLRVVGDVAASGLTNANSINFVTEHFELDAATGSIFLSSTGGALAGELGLYAETIHVAEGGILDQLADNPTYTGYQDDLNEAATVQRPEGVIRADTLWIESDNLQDILIQNTGSGGQNGTPAGFLVRQAFVNDDDEVAGPPGSINLVVNGQVVTQGGTLTGVEARDALVEGEDITPFTSNSTINGCPLTGECIIKPPAPPPVADVVDNQIDLIFSDPLGDSEFGNEDSIDDNEEGDEGANNPISPPQPLFDTRPLVPSSEIDDPVSGTGNPALVGGDNCENQDENGQCPVNPVEGDKQ